MNGAAAHLIRKGDEIIIMGFELTERPVKSKQIVLGLNNEFVRWLATETANTCLIDDMEQSLVGGRESCDS